MSKREYKRWNVRIVDADKNTKTIKHWGYNKKEVLSDLSNICNVDDDGREIYISRDKKNNICEEAFLRLDNCINGNPRYYLAQFLTCELKARDAGGVMYRGKRFGYGWVFTTYDLQNTCDVLNESKLINK